MVKVSGTIQWNFDDTGAEKVIELLNSVLDKRCRTASPKATTSSATVGAPKDGKCGGLPEDDVWRPAAPATASANAVQHAVKRLKHMCSAANGGHALDSDHGISCAAAAAVPPGGAPSAVSQSESLSESGARRGGNHEQLRGAHGNRGRGRLTWRAVLCGDGFKLSEQQMQAAATLDRLLSDGAQTPPGTPLGRAADASNPRKPPPTPSSVVDIASLLMTGAPTPLAPPDLATAASERPLKPNASAHRSQPASQRAAPAPSCAGTTAPVGAGAAPNGDGVELAPLRLFAACCAANPPPVQLASEYTQALLEGIFEQQAAGEAHRRLRCSFPDLSDETLAATVVEGAEVLDFARAAARLATRRVRPVSKQQNLGRKKVVRQGWGGGPGPLESLARRLRAEGALTPMAKV